MEGLGLVAMGSLFEQIFIVIWLEESSKKNIFPFTASLYLVEFNPVVAYLNILLSIINALLTLYTYTHIYIDTH